MRPAQPEPHTMAGAYAMDALDGADRSRFERHLAHCQECTREIAGLRETAARLAAAAAVPPPAALRERARLEIARTRQLPPLTGSARSPRRRVAGHEVLARRGTLARRGCARRRAHPRRGVPAGHGMLAPLRVFARRRIWVPGVAVALAAALAIVLAISTGGSGPLRPAAPRPSGLIAMVLTAPDATMLSGRIQTGGHATVVMSRHVRMLVFAASGLRSLSGARSYELWLMGPDGDRPAAVLHSRDGMTGPVIAEHLRAGDRLGLTVEPATGSRAPTSRPILLLTL